MITDRIQHVQSTLLSIKELCAKYLSTEQWPVTTRYAYSEKNILALCNSVSQQLIFLQNELHTKTSLDKLSDCIFNLPILLAKIELLETIKTQQKFLPPPSNLQSQSFIWELTMVLDNTTRCFNQVWHDGESKLNSARDHNRYSLAQTIHHVQDYQIRQFTFLNELTQRAQEYLHFLQHKMFANEYKYVSKIQGLLISLSEKNYLFKTDMEQVIARFKLIDKMLEEKLARLPDTASVILLKTLLQKHKQFFQKTKIQAGMSVRYH